MRIGIVVIKVVGHDLNHPARDLRTARVVEVHGGVFPASVLQGRELAPDVIYRRHVRIHFREVSRGHRNIS